MSYGISVTNTSNKIIIDQNFVNYIEIASGSASITGPSSSGGFPGVNNINISGYSYSKKDLIFVKMTSWGTGGVYGFTRSGGIDIWSFGTGTLHYRIFRNVDVSASPSTTGYGLEVFKPDQNLAFSSNYRVAPIATLITGSYPFTANFSWGSFYSLTSQPWICCSVGTGITGSDTTATFPGSSNAGIRKWTTVYSTPVDSFGIGKYGVQNDRDSGIFGSSYDQPGSIIIPVLRGY